MRGYALFILGVIVAVALAWVLAGRYVMPPQAAAIRAAAVICAGAGAVAMAPLMWASAKRSDWLIQAATGAIALRLVLSLGGGMAYQWGASPPEGYFLTCLGVAYVTMLVAETGMVVIITRKHWGLAKPAP